MRVALAAILLTCAAAAGAQEFDIYDPNDFLDPRIRGAVFAPGSLRAGEKGSDFTLIRLYGGRIYDYQWRNTSTGADLSFGNIATSYYHGDRQLNLKLTGFDTHGAANVPDFRGTLQGGQYFITGRSHGSQIAGRVLLTWSVERRTFREQAGSRSELNHEFGVETDVRVPLPHPIGNLDSLDGSFIWTRRRIAEHKYVDRVSYLYRFHQIQFDNGRFQFNANAGAGAERGEGWQCCLARAVFTATFIVPRINVGLNAAFAPTFSPASAGGRRTHRELALYLDRTVFARITDIVKR